MSLLLVGDMLAGLTQLCVYSCLSSKLASGGVDSPVLLAWQGVGGFLFLIPVLRDLQSIPLAL